jgi:hypothetical protein
LPLFDFQHQKSRPRSSISFTYKLFSPRSAAESSYTKPFRINTYKSVSKQRTLTLFRINTYEKHRGGGLLWLTRNPRVSVALRAGLCESVSSTTNPHGRFLVMGCFRFARL